MQTALDAYLAAGQQSLHAQKDLVIASVGLGCLLWIETIAPFYRTASDMLMVSARMAFPQIRAADVVQFGAVRDARVKRVARRAAALERG